LRFVRRDLIRLNVVHPDLIRLKFIRLGGHRDLKLSRWADRKNKGGVVRPANRLRNPCEFTEQVIYGGLRLS
jgi:hypothetical protein